MKHENLNAERTPGSLHPACSAARPITNRDLHEEAAGMGLCAEFFTTSNINPDAPVECKCKWDGGHEPTCNIVAAHALLAKRHNEKLSRPATPR